MSNLVKIPLEDKFRTSLSQQWTGWTGTVNVAWTPNFTFPSGVTTYVVVNPWKSTMQIAEIDSYNATNKTLNVSNITLNKGASISSTAQTHAVGSEVIISDNYQVWEDIQTAINSKLDDDLDWTWDSATTFAWIIAKSLTTTQRDALTWSNGMIIYNSTTSVLNQYIWWVWVSFSSWTTINATETVAGKWEVATDSEITTPTDTGWTGAFLWAKISQLVKLFSFAPSLTTSAETDKYAFQDVSNWDKTTTILKSDLRNDLAWSKTTKGTFEMLTDAEFIAGTDETRVPNAKQIADNAFSPIYKNIYISASQTLSASTIYTFTHSLWFTSADVLQWRYKVVLYCSFWTWWDWIQAWDTSGSSWVWGGSATVSPNVFNQWTTSNPADWQTVSHQTNALKIRIWTTWWWTGRLGIIQMY